MIREQEGYRNRAVEKREENDVLGPLPLYRFSPPSPPAAALTLPVHPPLSERWILVHEETIGTIEGE